MIRPQLPLNALRAFEASARHLSFTRAAVELCVTQAAVSHQVKSLEAQLNVTLFKRLPRGLMLTSEGETLLPVLSTSFDHIAQMLELGGWDNPQQNAEAILALETKIAEAHWTRAESRNRDKTYNPVELSAFATTAPGFPWATYFAAAGVPQAPRAVVRQSTAIPKLAAIFGETDIATLQAWQAFHTTDDAAGRLSQRFSDAQWEFRSRDLSGQPEQRSREKRAPFGATMSPEAARMRRRSLVESSRMARCRSARFC